MLLHARCCRGTEKFRVNAPEHGELLADPKREGHACSRAGAHHTLVKSMHPPCMHVTHEEQTFTEKETPLGAGLCRMRRTEQLGKTLGNLARQ